MEKIKLLHKAFNDLKVDFIEKDDELWLTGEQIGMALEYEEPRKSINNIYDRNKDELDEYSVDTNLMSTDGKNYMTRIYNEKGVMLITMLSKQPKAKGFRRWAVQVLEAFRHGKLKKLKTLAEKKADWEGFCLVAEKVGAGDDLAVFTLKDEGFSETGEIPPEYKEKPKLKTRARLNTLVESQNKWAMNIYRHQGVPLPEQYQLNF